MKEFSPSRITGPLNDYCIGAKTPTEAESYVSTVYLTTGTSSAEVYKHNNNNGLADILAFDAAETRGPAYLGQINMSVVSSFSSPDGYLWGYDIVPSEKGFLTPKEGPEYISEHGQRIPLFSTQSLESATAALYGSRKNTHFPIKPGSMVYCAEQHLTMEGPIDLFCAVGVGISEYDHQDAYLFMENVWAVQSNTFSVSHVKEETFEALAASVIDVGKNSNLRYKHIFVGFKHLRVGEGQIGCSMVVIPYVLLAKRAVINDDGNTYPLSKMTLEEWVQATR